MVDFEKIKPLLSKSWSMSWPMILIMIFEFLINLTDVFIAGKIGKEVQAAVGFISQIYFVFIVAGNSMTMGSVSIISKLFTSENKKLLSETIFSSFILVAFLGLLLSIAGVFVSPYVIDFLNVPEEVKMYGRPLIQIYAPMLFFHYILINSNGILRACGMVKKSLITMFIVCIANVGLNFYFVFHTGLGFRGIALSTVCSILIGVLINVPRLYFMINKNYSFLYGQVKRIFSIGWPSGLVQISWQTASTVLFLIIGLIPYHKVETIAAFTNGMRIEAVIFLPAFAFSMANAVVVGNLIGADKKDEAYKNGIITALMGGIVITTLTVIVALNARTITSFLSTNELVINESIKYLYISVISEPFMAFGSILIGALNGSGDTKSVMIRVISSLWIVRIPLAYILGVVAGFGSAGVWGSMTISIIIQSALIFQRYKSKRWLLNEK